MRLIDADSLKKKLDEVYIEIDKKTGIAGMGMSPLITLDEFRQMIDEMSENHTNFVDQHEEAKPVDNVSLNELCKRLGDHEFIIPCDLCNYYDTECWEKIPGYCPNSAEDWRKALTKVLDDDLPIFNERR